MTNDRCRHCDQLPGIKFLHLWMTTENPMLGGISPMEMLKAGRGNRLAQFIESARADEGIVLDGCSECQEQARLLGMSAQRELKLQTEVRDWKEKAEYWKKRYDRLVTEMRRNE